MQRDGGLIGRGALMTDTLACAKQTASGELRHSTGAHFGAQMTRGGWEETQGDGRICIHAANSLCCTAEMNTTVKQLYPIINKNKLKLGIV